MYRSENFMSALLEIKVKKNYTYEHFDYENNVLNAAQPWSGGWRRSDAASAATATGPGADHGQRTRARGKTRGRARGREQTRTFIEDFLGRLRIFCGSENWETPDQAQDRPKS